MRVQRHRNTSSAPDPDWLQQGTDEIEGPNISVATIAWCIAAFCVAFAAVATTIAVIF